MFERNGQKLGSVLVESTGPSEVEDAEVDPFDAVTVVELKEMLSERGLPTSGNKAELFERLQAADEADENDTKEEPDGNDDEA